MTVVIAARTKDKCWLAFDSGASTDEEIYEAATPKGVRHAGGGLMGASASWLVINMLDSIKTTECDPQDIVAALAGVRENTPKELKDAEVLMVWPGRPIVGITEAGGVVEYAHSFVAIGEGSGYAVGYLESCKELNAQVLKKAVEVAAKYSTHVLAPAKVLTLEKVIKAKEKPKGPVNET